MKRIQHMRTLFALLLICGLSACGSAPMLGDGVIDLTLKITIADDVNPDENGRASPVFLQVIELRDPTAFERADYLDLYQDAEATLGGAFLDSTEIGPMFPGTTRSEELRLNTATGAIGLLGEFRQYADMQTTVAIALKPGTDARVNVLIDGSGVHLQ